MLRLAMKPMRFVSLAIFFAVAILLSRCGNKGPASGTFGSVYTVTLKTACINCHQPGGAATALDFTTQATAYNTLFGNVRGPIAVGTCGTVKIVVPSNPNTSYLPAALFADYRTAGNQMKGVPACTPFITNHNLNLSDAEKTSMITWITNGAKND